MGDREGAGADVKTAAAIEASGIALATSSGYAREHPPCRGFLRPNQLRIESSIDKMYKAAKGGFIR